MTTGRKSGKSGHRTLTVTSKPIRIDDGGRETVLIKNVSGSGVDIIVAKKSKAAKAHGLNNNATANTAKHGTATRVAAVQQGTDRGISAIVLDSRSMDPDRELMQKDKIGKPLSEADNLKPGRSRILSTAAIDPKLTYNPKLFEGDVVGVKVAKDAAKSQYRNVATNENAKV